jgi:hypothetical protein
MGNSVKTAYMLYAKDIKWERLKTINNYK